MPKGLPNAQVMGKVERMKNIEYMGKFENDQIEKIKAFLVDVCRVRKTLCCLAPMAYCNGVWVAISVDIRPWEDEYEIEL